MTTREFASHRDSTGGGTEASSIPNKRRPVTPGGVSSYVSAVNSGIKTRQIVPGARLRRAPEVDYPRRFGRTG